MRDDYVVERGVFLAEASEAYFEDHCCAVCRGGGGAECFTTMCKESGRRISGIGGAT